MIGIPDWRIEDDKFIERYTTELRAVQTLEQLKATIKRWSALWTAGGHGKPQFVAEVDDYIVSGSVTEEDLKCVRLTFGGEDGEGVPCPHCEDSELCPGMEIRMPWSTLIALDVSSAYGITISGAFHQLFCGSATHICCFR